MYPAELEAAEPMVQRQPVVYCDINYDVGRINGQFFAALRDQGRIMATCCTACARTYLPPRISCPECFAELDEWVDAGDTGTLTAFTIVREPGMLQQMPVPYVVGLIQLDGADTALVHYLGEVDPDVVKAGMRVRAVLAQERTGWIGDIRYFTPMA